MAELVGSPEEAVRDVPDGATVMIGGFGSAGQPVELIEALIRQGAGALTVVNNNAGNGDRGLAALIGAGRVRKIICSFPRQTDSQLFDAAYRAGDDRAGAGRAGQPGRADPCGGCGHRWLLHAHGYGTPLAEGKEVREIAGRHHVLELPIHADVALVRAHVADRMGNLVYRKTARNFGPIMAPAARTTIVQVHQVVSTGELDPEAVVTPGIYVDRLVQVETSLPVHFEEGQ